MNNRPVHTLYAADEATSDASVPAMLARLEHEQEHGQLSVTVLEFWGHRFCLKRVQFLARVSFEKYLRRPRYYERIAEARMELRRREKAGVPEPVEG